MLFQLLNKFQISCMCTYFQSLERSTCMYWERAVSSDHLISIGVALWLYPRMNQYKNSRSTQSPSVPDIFIRNILCRNSENNWIYSHLKAECWHRKLTVDQTLSWIMKRTRNLSREFTYQTRYRPSSVNRYVNIKLINLTCCLQETQFGFARFTVEEYGDRLISFNFR